jgi:hypothetical protein
LKAPDQRFKLFKIITLPERISSGKTVQYFVDYAYFGLNDNQRDYFLYTEAQFDCAKNNSYMTGKHLNLQLTLTCEASMFFHNTNSAI